MTERSRLFLEHVLSAIAAIEDFTSDGRTAFYSDLKTQSAVIRQLEIIGEAVKQLDASVKAAHPQVPWRLIAGARDRLIHAYFKVDLDSVWAMVEQDLEPLKREVQGILGKL